MDLEAIVGHFRALQRRIPVYRKPDYLARNLMLEACWSRIACNDKVASQLSCL